MPGLIVLLLVGLMLAYIHKKNIEDVLPPFVMTLMLFNYALAIIGKGHHSFMLSMCLFALIVVVAAAIFIRRTFVLKEKLQINYKNHIGFYVFLAVCLIMAYCYSTHFVNVWDDFHYNATFPKDCYYYGTVPYGYNLATFYKSYLPLLQLFFYWGFQGFGFSESMMFVYKMILIYTLLLPLYKKANTSTGLTKVVSLIFPTILPFLFMFEVQESLSMDTVMAAIFAYAVIMISCEDKEKDGTDIFRMYCILVSTVCLILMKSIAAMFAGITLGIWLFVLIVKRRKGSALEWISFLVTGIAALSAWLSWKIYCNIHGNTTYLSNILADNLSGDGKFALPSYGPQTIKNILKSIATLNLNLSRSGMSLLTVVVIAALLLVILKLIGQFDRIDFWTVLILCAGLLVYIAFLCYSYCFIFEQWEAEDLSSLDRYFGTYAFVISYVVLYRVIGTVKANGDEGILMKCLPRILMGVLVVFFITLPFMSLRNVLNPYGYLEARADLYNIRNEVSEEMETLTAEGRTMGYIVIVNNSENDMYSRSMDYEVIPLVSRPFNSGAYDNLSDRQAAFDEKIDDIRPDFIYFTNHERAGWESGNNYEIPDEYEIYNMDGLYKRN